jgi:hypothetical protein
MMPIARSSKRLIGMRAAASWPISQLARTMPMACRLKPMSDQAEMFGAEPPPPPPKTRHDEMREQWERYHADNPHVWATFRTFTFQLINAGREHGAVMMIVQRMRWESAVRAGADEENHFKINNNHGPFYGRLFEDTFSEHEGFFRTRHQTSKDHGATNLAELRPGDFE